MSDEVCAQTTSSVWDELELFFKVSAEVLESMEVLFIFRILKNSDSHGDIARDMIRLGMR